MPAWHRPYSVAGEAGPGEHRQSSCGRFNPFPRLGWPRRNAVGLPSVKLDTASVAPLRAGAVHPHVTWAVTYTCPGSGLSASRQESSLFPCAEPRFTPSCHGSGSGSRETDIREVPSRPQARLLGAGRPGTWKPSAGTGRGSRAQIRKPSWTLMWISRRSESSRAQRTGSGRHLGGRGS